MTRQRIRQHRHAAFTLVEVMIVVVIISILASLAVPKFLDFESESVESAVKTDLSVLRKQIELYKFEHDAYPATLNALVTDGYIPVAPVHPGTGNWVYNAGTGELRSSADASW
jgi:general secretion pathway protein G